MKQLAFAIIDNFPCQLILLVLIVGLSLMGINRLIKMWNYEDQYKSLKSDKDSETKPKNEE